MRKKENGSMVALTCMLVHRRSRKTGRYHRSCKSLQLSGTAAPASARPPSLQQNRRKKIFINARVRNSGKYCRAFRKTFPFPFSSIYISLSLFLSLLISLHFPRIVRDSRLRTDVQPRANKSTGFVEAARKKENDIRIRRQRIPRPRAFSFQSARARISLWCANATGGKKEESRGRQPGKTGGFMNRSVPLATFPPHRFQIRIVERRSVAEDNSFECVPHIRNGTFIPLCPDSSSLKEGIHPGSIIL